MQGHIHKRTRAAKDGRQVTTWYVVVEMNRGSDGHRRQKWHGGFRTRKEAEAAKAKLVNEIHAGLYLEPAKTTLEGWIESSWLPTMRTQVKPSTWDSYMRNLRLHVVPRIGHRPLQQLSPAILNDLYAELMESGRKNGPGGGLSPKTVRYVHATVHKVLTDAVDAGLLSINPADRARPPKPRVAVQSEMRCWDAEQLAKFLVHVEGHRLQAAFHLAAMTGMRRGEVLGLRWQDVDFTASRIAVRHTLVSVAYQLRDSTPKTHQARVVDIDGGTLDHLRAHRTRQEAERLSWGSGYQKNDLVFRGEDGSPVHPDSFTQTFGAEVRQSGLPRIRLHDLRHTHATIAGKGAGQGHQRATRTREPSLHPQAIRPRHPRDAGRSRRPHRRLGDTTYSDAVRASRCASSGAPAPRPPGRGVPFESPSAPRYRPHSLRSLGWSQCWRIDPNCPRDLSPLHA